MSKYVTLDLDRLNPIAEIMDSSGKKMILFMVAHLDEIFKVRRALNDDDPNLLACIELYKQYRDTQPDDLVFVGYDFAQESFYVKVCRTASYTFKPQTDGATK